ncbi:MAG: hypothetical protein GY906_39300 [bacterium]|nr:hypothetical protein [bacterium]
MDYPIWDVTVGGGVLMGIVAIAHVIVSHFAIGGGLLIAVSETLAVRRGDSQLRELARRSSFALILISTVFGAISGVGIWVVAGLIAPGAISALIHNYVWGWAIEWAFFFLEIVAALVYFATWDKISKAAHVMVGWVYFVAAYLSLVIINGIVTFMLTPGQWLETGAFWDGFFNPTYWPSLVLRTGICLMMAASFLLFAARRADAEARSRLTRFVGWWMVAGVLVSYAGYRWWEAALPETVRAMFQADSPLITGLNATRSMTLWALAVALGLALVFLVALPRAARLPIVAMVAVAAFIFFGSYERLREAVRKPFLIHSFMFSNGLGIDDIASINENGMASVSGWVAAAAEDGQLAFGRQLFRTQCAACHTVDGYLAMRERVFEEAEDNSDFLMVMRAQGDYYLELENGQIAVTSDYDIPYMPPFVGNDEDIEALGAYLATLAPVAETDTQEAGGE